MDISGLMFFVWSKTLHGENNVFRGKGGNNIGGHVAILGKSTLVLDTTTLLVMCCFEPCLYPNTKVLIAHR